jgi:preprotein translocase subunit YajC
MQFDNQTTRNVADIVARILAGESVKQEPKMLEEELVGNQHKIDANKNNKIDAHDFKLLRKKKKVEEETELTESHFKIGDEVICKASGMEGEVVKIDEPQTGKYYTVKQENGKMVKYAPNELKKEEEDEDEEDDEDENKMKSEEVHNKKKDDTPSTSNSAKKPVRNSDGTIQSPISRARELAQQGLKRAMNKEEVEQIDELSKDTLKSYAGKVIDKTRTMPQGEKKQKHLIGLERSMDKMKKEETEIDEAMFPGTKEYEKKYGQSPQQKLRKKGDTVPTSQGDMTKTDKGIAHRRRFTEMLESYTEGGLKYIASLVQEEPDNEEFTKEVEEVKRKATQKKSPEDEARVAKASVQAVKNEEVEELDEAYNLPDGDIDAQIAHHDKAQSKHLERYVDARVKRTTEKKHPTDPTRVQKVPMGTVFPAKMDPHKNQSDEEKVHVDLYSRHVSMRDALKHYKKSGDKKQLTYYKNEHKRTQDRYAKHPWAGKKINEEVELDELSKSTLASYAKKASHEARMKHGIGKDFERISKSSRKPEYKQGAKEWEDKYKSDARRRESGVGKAIDRLAKEETEIQVINADIANGVQFDNIEERSLSEPEMKKREEIVMSMKKKMPGFKERYGDRAKEVMYATATKMAKKD